MVVGQLNVAAVGGLDIGVGERSVIRVLYAAGGLRLDVDIGELEIFEGIVRVAFDGKGAAGLRGLLISPGVEED